MKDEKKTLFLIAIYIFVLPGHNSLSAVLPASELAEIVGASDSKLGQPEVDWSRHGQEMNAAVASKIWENPDKGENIAIGRTVALNDNGNGDTKPEITGGSIVFTRRFNFLDK